MGPRTLPPWPHGRPLRAWQTAALERLRGHSGRSFLASATPAAGKTTFGLRAAHELLSSGRVERVAVLAPTTHICRQWARDAARVGIDLDPNRPNAAGPEPRDRHGLAVTYQTVATRSGSRVHRAACAARRTLLIADEPHHMGEQAAWGARALEAFGAAEPVLLLSGTPFRSDGEPIPWVSYDEDGVSSADFSYGYTDALLERVCRPVTFLTYDGEMEWSSDGRLRRADFSVALPRAEAARRLRTALDPDGDWVGDVLRDADVRLSEVRMAGHPDAGGLVVAADKDHARALAARLEPLCGEPPAVVTSDDPQASALIAGFAASARRWLVAVLMVSEGVDIPRLRVGVYATAARTELFFRQVVGRFVRRTPAPRRQMAYLLMPSDPRLKELAARVEEERNHALALGAAGEDEEQQPEVEPVRAEAGEGFLALSSQARLDAEIVSSVAPGENLSLFGAGDGGGPAPSPALAAFTAGAGAQSGAGVATAGEPDGVDERFERLARLAEAGEGGSDGDGRPGESAYERRERLRAERRTLVASRARQTGEQHRVIHARINRASGARSVSAATADQLARGNDLLRRELARASARG